MLSLAVKITLHGDPKAILGVPGLYILAIGAGRYRDLIKRLNFAVKDAEALAGTLKEAGTGTLFDDEVSS